MVVLPSRSPKHRNGLRSWAEPWQPSTSQHNENRGDHPGPRTVARTPCACDGGFGSRGLCYRARSRESDPHATVGETFTPALSIKGPGLLTPTMAYERGVSKGKDMPAGTAHQLGYLTLPLGAGAPGQYTARNALVYAFTWPHCGPHIGPVPMPGASSTPTPTPASTDCTQWEFVDARTGA